MGLLRKALGTQYVNVVPVLPPEEWFVQPHYFQFGMPWPWEKSPDTQPVIDIEAGDNLESFGYAYAPRSDAAAQIALWQEPGRLDQPNLANTVAINRQARLLATATISLGGMRAMVITVETASTRTYMTYCDRAGYLVAAQFDCPRHVAQAYAPHLDTMLGTWEWFR